MVVKDTSRPIMLREHTENPFVSGLGPPPSFDDQLDILTVLPDYDPAEREYPHHLRRYCVLRLLDFRSPLVRQFELIERIGMVIRQGYKGRNPSQGNYRKSILNAAAKAKSGESWAASNSTIEITSCGFAVLGYPGMGKTMTVNRALEHIPKILTPELPYSVTQIPWLKVECPARGSPKQFCIAFFAALDERLSTTDHKRKYATNRRSTEEMMLDVQRLASIYALGLLVIDEIQHLKQSVIAQSH